MRWVIFALAALGVAACSDAEKAAMSNGGECFVTSTLVVSPERVTRGDPTTITITWSTADVVDSPTATLLAGDDYEIEVELPLAVDGGCCAYTSTVTNPFGAGAPEGPVAVLAEGSPPYCETPSSATTSFVLE